MAFSELLFKTWDRNLLFTVMLELTYRCNLDCHFCYNDLKRPGRALSREQYLSLLADLASMQVLNLTLTGGEPTLHPDFFEIGSRARELGFVVRIKSNGHGLRGATARRIRDEIDPFLIEISLHGATAATHDRQTKVKGSFDRLTTHIPELLGLGFRLKLNTTVTEWNLAEIEAMCTLADAWGIPIALNSSVTPRDDGDRTPQSIGISLEGKRRVFELLARRSPAPANEPRRSLPIVAANPSDEPPTPSDKNCGAGSTGVTIDPYGNVLPCVQWRRPVGNLHERSILEIWKKSSELAEVRATTVAAKALLQRSHGPDATLMGFCPGLAELLTGNPLSMYDHALQQMEALKGLRESTEGVHRPPNPEAVRPMGDPVEETRA